MKAVLVRLQNVDYIVVAVFNIIPQPNVKAIHILYTPICTYILYIYCTYIYTQATHKSVLMAASSTDILS